MRHKLYKEKAQRNPRYSRTSTDLQLKEFSLTKQKKLDLEMAFKIQLERKIR